MAGLAKGEKYPNLSCDFIWEKKKKKRQQRGWRVCPAERPPRRGERERHASILLAEAWSAGQGFCQKELWAGAELQSRKLLWLHAGSPSPNTQEGKGSLSTRGLISVPCGAGLLPATQLQSLFTFPRASGSCRDESSLSGKKPKQVSFYYLVLPHY